VSTDRWGWVMLGLGLYLGGCTPGRGDGGAPAPDGSATSAATATPAADGEEPPAARVAPVPNAPVVLLSRAPCFGGCPVYAVALWADGRVQWDGRGQVRDSGVHESRIPADSVAALVQRLAGPAAITRDHTYEEGAPACGRYFPDGPRFELAVVTPEGARFTVRVDAGCTEAPRLFTTLADEVDRVAGTRARITGAEGAVP
jgi:hypothetical protein